MHKAFALQNQIPDPTGRKVPSCNFTPEEVPYVVGEPDNFSTDFFQPHWDEFVLMLRDGGCHVTGSGYAGVDRLWTNIVNRYTLLLEAHHEEKDSPDSGAEYAIHLELCSVYQRLHVLSEVLGQFETCGSVKLWDDLAETVRNALLVSARGKAYMRAVLAIKDRRFESAVNYFEAIASRSPKSNGDLPTPQAPWDWFKVNGYIENGERFGTSRLKIEEAAKKLLEMGALAL